MPRRDIKRLRVEILDFLPNFVSTGPSQRFLTPAVCQCHDRADISGHRHVTMGHLKSSQLK
jgi:hypothetical protein